MLAVFVAAGSSAAQAQRRDCFTDAEVELIRDAQDIDLRIKVLTHAIDRRFAVIKVNVAATDLKESDKWGPPPTGTRVDLLFDIKRILQKAIDDIDDTATHAGTTMARTPENPNRKDKAEPPFARAMHALAAAAKRYKSALNTEIAAARDPKEKGPMLDSIDFCDQILEAEAKVAAEPAKPSGKNR